MLDVHRLRLLRELHHRGTLAAVAKALSYSPSAISQQLALLEAEVGAPLLEHVGRRVRLTAQADILVRHTEALLEQLERAEADIAASFDGISGRVRVASFQTATMALIPSALSRLSARHPALRVEIRDTEPEWSLPALAVRDYDLVLGEEYPGHLPLQRPDLVVWPLGLDPMWLACPARRQGADLADLADAAWVMEPEGTVHRAWSTALCRGAGFEPDVRYESADPLLHLRLVETGHAAAMLPNLVWAGASRPLVVRALPGSPARRIFTAVRRGTEEHPALQAVRTALQEALVELQSVEQQKGAETPQ
jgi:DNA-binding transcriptional LysR family regulator